MREFVEKIEIASKCHLIGRILALNFFTSRSNFSKIKRIVHLHGGMLVHSRALAWPMTELLPRADCNEVTGAEKAC